MPGKSITVIFCPSKLRVPSAFSTVFPGQFPIIWLEPVSWLNRTLFPTFALPAKAMVKPMLFPGFLGVEESEWQDTASHLLQLFLQRIQRRRLRRCLAQVQPWILLRRLQRDP